MSHLITAALSILIFTIFAGWVMDASVNSRIKDCQAMGQFRQNKTVVHCAVEEPTQ